MAWGGGECDWQELQAHELSVGRLPFCPSFPRALRHWCCRIPRHQTEVRADRHCDRWTDVRRDGTKQVWSTEIRSIRVWSHSNEYTMESNKICNACEAPLHHQTRGCFLPAALSRGSFWRLRTHFEGRHFLDVERRP